MAITKVSRGLLNTGVSDSSDATAITIDSDENIGFNTTGIAAGSTSSASNSTATPKKIVINNDYSNGATDASLKLYLYNSGSVRQGFTSGSNYDLQYHNSGHATGRHAFYVGNTESVRIDADGIKFNGDSAAVNALDDYEEGSYTPTSGASLTVTTANYTKIGRLVFLNGDITVGSTSGSSSFAMSLPFAGEDGYYSGLVQYNNVPEPQLAANISTTHLYFRKLDTSFGFLNYTGVSGHRFIFSIVYTTAS